VADNRYSIASLDRAVSVLEVLASEKGGKTLAALGKTTDIPKSTLFRILSTLRDRDIVSLDMDTKKYTLGLKLRELGNAFIRQTDLDGAASPYLRDLAESCEESVFLALLDETEVVYVRRMESPNSVMMVRKLGNRAPVCSTATGQAMVASLPENRREEIVTEMDFASADHPYASSDDFKERLNAVRKEGVAIVDGEYNPELLCVSSPILGTGATVEAAITVAMPSSEATSERLGSIADEVKEKALKISQQMGYRKSRRGIAQVSGL
jgi:DNA-binding IclR family transcriptional regulator